MKMVKCPVCKGQGEYEVEQHFEGKTYITPVVCEICGGEKKITWSYFCSHYRQTRRR